MNTWLENFLETSDLSQYPISKRTEGGVIFKTGARESASVFVGHPVHYVENNQWKPITLNWIPSTGEFEGSWFGWSEGGKSVTYCGYDVFLPRSVIWNGISRPLTFARHENRMIADVSGLGIYEIVFSEWGVNEIFTVPEPVEGVLEFDVQKTEGWDGYLHEHPRMMVGTDLTGDVYTLTLDMAYPVVIDPDYSADSADGRTDGQNATYATARTTSSNKDSTGANMLTGQQYAAGTYRCYRGHLKFDTSGIPDGDTITQVNAKLTVTTDSSTTDFDLMIMKQDWSAYDPITAGNQESVYDGCLAATSDGLWRNTSGMSTNTQYTSANLDTTRVSKTGFTYYGIMSQRDIDGTAPTGNEYVQVASQNNTNAGYRPVLAVTHSASGGWANITKINGTTSTNVAKINGVTVSNISKVNGVAV